jgi:hypothetical protein
MSPAIIAPPPPTQQSCKHWLAIMAGGVAANIVDPNKTFKQQKSGA